MVRCHFSYLTQYFPLGGSDAFLGRPFGMSMRSPEKLQSFWPFGGSVELLAWVTSPAAGWISHLEF